MAKRINALRAMKDYEAKDKALDKKQGVKEDSKKDKMLDKKAMGKK